MEDEIVGSFPIFLIREKNLFTAGKNSSETLGLKFSDNSEREVIEFARQVLPLS